MEPFSIVFSLFGLLLGLSLARVLTGFERALRMRSRVRMGWLIPLLGLFVLLDVTSFWNGAWQMRHWLEPDYGHLFVALAVTAAYYLAATAVFPGNGTTIADHDRHYFATRRWILLAIGGCNLAVFGWQYWRDLWLEPTSWWVAIPSYFALLITAAITRRKDLSIACIAGLIGIYLFLAVKTLSGWGG